MSRILLVSLVVFCLVVLSHAVPSAPRAAAPICSLPPAERQAALRGSSVSRVSALPGEPYSGYAEAAFNTFYTTMYNPARQVLRLAYMSPQPSNYWNSAIAFHTLLQYVDFHRASPSASHSPSAPDVVAMVEGLVQEQTRLNESDPQLRNRYNDDMSWMVHALTALYDHTGNHTYIDMADLLFTTIKQSDDTTCCGDMKGGIWWDLAHSSKATAAQAGVSLAAIRLRETKASSYAQDMLLQYSAEHFAFWRLHMVNASGQVCDSINKDGRRNWWSFSYNEGLMIADAVHLYNATGNKTYLADAALLAGFLMRGINVSINGTERTILANDCGGGCSNDAAEFHQVGYQYMTEYYRLLVSLLQAGEADAATLAAHCEVFDFLQANVDSLWINARNPKTGTFNCNWDGPFTRGQDGLQGAMNAAMSAFALFANLPVITTAATAPHTAPRVEMQ